MFTSTLFYFIKGGMKMSSTKITEFDLDPNMGLAKESSVQEIKLDVEQILNETAKELTLTQISNKIDSVQSSVESNTSGGSSDILGNLVHGSQEFTPGTYNWTCPDGVNVIVAMLASGGGGGGGGGGYYSNGGRSGASGGGAAAGNVWIGLIPVSSGSQYELSVGSGGSGGAAGVTNGNGTNGGNGGNTTFGDFVTVLGGFGGKYGESKDGPAGSGGSNNTTNILKNIGFKCKTETYKIGGNGKSGDGTGSGTSGGGAGGSAVTTDSVYVGFTGAAGGKGGGTNNSSSPPAYAGTKGGDGKVYLMW